MTDDLRRAVARVIVRRHLSDLIGQLGTEDQIATLFLRCAEANPDVSMRDAVDAFRQTAEGRRLRPSVTIETLDCPP